MSARLKLVTPTNQNRKVRASSPAGRLTNEDYRKREHLTGEEVDKLIAAAKGSRYPERNAALILVMFRHGLRAYELAALEWSQIDFKAATMHITRVKRGKPSTHPIRGDELRRLRALHREKTGPWVFSTERGGPFTADMVNRLIKSLGKAAKLPFPAHAHMLRHACGYALANSGHDTRSIQDYLGHVSIQHTVRYTELSPTKFKEFWR